MTQLLRLFVAILCVSLFFSSIPLTTSMGAAQRGDEVIDLSAKGARILRAERGNPLTSASGKGRREIVRDFLAARGVAASTLDTLDVVRENRSAHSPVSHLTYEQEVGGLRVYGTYVKASVNDRGELVSLIENIVNAPGAGVARAAINARQAYEATLLHRYPNESTGLLAAAEEVETRGNATRFAKGTFFYSEPTATRVAIPFRGGAVREGYLVETWREGTNELWHTLIDGKGEVVYQELRTNSDSYNVFQNHPLATPQAIVNGPGAGNAQSPSGWVTNNTTTGNNVDAYLDRDNNNGADTNGRPVSATKDFVATADLTQAPTTTTNQMVAVQNLFYLNNVIHDKLYRHGFTEAVGNFQENNFGKGGAASDSVNAEAQDGGGTNNANFATPGDGSNPRMQMYLWNTVTPNRDGDVDSDIVWHEYGHGLTWRMIGSMSGPFAGAIGEGNSDVLAIYANNNDPVGEYSTNNFTRGIRRNPYTNYPRTYANVTGSSVHNDGEIYAATMWYLWQLFQENGLSNDLLFDYMVDGMNFTPARPAYEDMRDGILAAITDPAHECLVWKAFAKFGIGVGANGVENCNIFTCSISVTQSFAVPPEYSTCGGTPPPNNPPTANFTFSTSGLTANFTDTSSDSDGTIASRSWDFGDGNSSTATNPSWTYASAGTYNVTLTVTDDDGASTPITKAVTVTAATGITLSVRAYKVKGVQHADLTWTPSGPGTATIERNSQVITNNTPNDGAYTDNIGNKGGGTYTYRVCVSGTCSNTVTITF